MVACDALLNQDLFAGSGNIIKNEVLFRIGVHPWSTLGALPDTTTRCKPLNLSYLPLSIVALVTG